MAKGKNQKKDPQETPGGSSGEGQLQADYVLTESALDLSNLGVSSCPSSSTGTLLFGYLLQLGLTIFH